MSEAFRVTWQSMKDLWDEFIILILLNILWCLAIVVTLAPLLLWGAVNPILALVLSFLLFWLVPVVSGALCFVTNQIAHGRAANWETFRRGLRGYWVKSLIVSLINLIVVILIATNILFYANVLQGTWTNFAVSAWVVVALYWLITQIYWFPMILELENEKVLEALRNALLLVIASPAFSLIMAAILLVLAVLCIALTIPVPLFMAALLMLIINRATLSRVADIREKYESREEEQ